MTAAHSDGQARSDTIIIQGHPGVLTYDVSIVLLGESGGALLLARDVSLAANLRQALAESRQRFKDLVEISSDFAWETDAAGAFAFVSPKGALGWKATDLLGQSATSFIADAESGRGASPFTTRALLTQSELWLRGANGAPACVSISALPLIGPDGAWKGARGVWRDVTELHERDAALAEVQNRERLVGYITRTIRDEVEPDAMLAAAASAAARALGCRGGLPDLGMAGRRRACPSAADFGIAPADAAETGMAAHARRLKSDADEQYDAIEIGSAEGRFLGAKTALSPPDPTARSACGVTPTMRHRGDESDRAIAAKIADQIGIAQEQIANHEALAKQARTDALTGLVLQSAQLHQAAGRRAGELRTRSGEAGTLIYARPG